MEENKGAVRPLTAGVSYLIHHGMFEYRGIAQVEDQSIPVRSLSSGAIAGNLAGSRQVLSHFAGEALSERLLDLPLLASRRLSVSAGGDASEYLTSPGEALVVDFKNSRLKSLPGGARRCQTNILPSEQGRAKSGEETQVRAVRRTGSPICALQWFPSKNRVFSSETLTGKFLPSYSKSFPNDFLPVVAQPASISEPPCSVPAILFRSQTRRALAAPTRTAP
jgi:hypothetical protein